VRRFEFRLENVLKLKRQRQRLAEQQQLRARAALDAARAEAAAIREQIARIATALAVGLAGAVRDGSWLRQHEQALRLGPRLELAEDTARLADVRYQEASAARTQIATEVEALQHLREQQSQAHRLDVLRAQQEQLDEVGMRKWRAGPGGSPVRSS
jgi:flagellar protein FliJ